VIGHGASDAPADPERYSMAHAVRDLTAVLDALDVERAAVQGYSMGGRLALHFALDAPDRLDALVLESASPGIEDANERAARVEADNALADRIERDGIEAFVDYWQAIPLFASQSRLPAEVLAEQRRRRLGQAPQGMANSLRGMGAGRQDYLLHRLREIRVPTLLLAGALDERYAELARTMGSLIRDSQLEIIADAGHAVHLEQPDAFLAAVAGFLGKQAKTTADRQRISR
jgi:2-succinyl-6-hydroxy-2,4-cyclohexadiene-1-carboxylate synthase